MTSIASVTPWVQSGDIETDPRLTGVELPPSISLAQCTQVATDILFKRSGRKFTVRSDVIRPNRVTPSCDCLDFDICRCELGNEFVFSDPINAVTSVKVDGATLIAGVDYQVFDHRRLVRTTTVPTGRTAWWPCCQRLSIPDDQPGTWTVTVLHGITPTDGAYLACYELAVQLALHYGGSTKCKLPVNTRSVSRQGVSVQRENPPYLMLREGVFGIPVIDMWLMSENPGGRRRRSAIMSPDTITSAYET